MSQLTLRGTGICSVLAIVVAGCSSAQGANDSDASGGMTASAGTSSGGASSGSGGLGGGTSTGGGISAGSGGAGVAGTGAGGVAAAGTSSAAGTGGSGGTATIPHEVGQCDDLGEVGVWEEITHPGGDPGDFVLDPQHAGTLYVGSSYYNTGVWKTTDCGSSWENVSTGTNGAELKAGRQTTFKIDPVSGALYTNGLYGVNGIFKSTNGGVDWEHIVPSGQGMIDFIGHVDIDPDDPQHLFALFHAPCGGPNDEYTFDDGVGCFGETTDGGSTWNAHYKMPKFPPEVMVFLLHGSTWIAAADGLQRTTDGGETWTKVADDGAGGHSTRPPYHAASGAYYDGTGGGVLRSDPDSDGTSWSLISSTGPYNLGTTGDGKNIYVAGHNGVYTSPDSDGVNWTQIPGTPSHGDGCAMDPHTFDTDHHLLYVSCFEGDGMWRMRTE